MALGTDWTDWADGKDLAGISQATDPLQRAGYDPEELRADPVKRMQAMQAMAGPYPAQASAAAAPVQNKIGAPTSSQVSRTATSTPATDYNQIGQEALNKAMSLGGFAEQTAHDLASSSGPDTATLEARRSQLATPTPYRDPQTGQVLDSAKQYEPTTGQKILRGIRGGVVGFLSGGLPGAIVGAVEPQDIRGGQAYGAPNRAYQTAEQNRQAELASTDQQIKEAQDRFKAMTDARSKAASEARQGVTAYKDVAQQAGDLLKTGIQQQKEDRAENAPPAEPKTYEEMVLRAFQETDPVKKQQYENAARQIRQTEVRKFQAANAGGGTGMPLPGNQGASGNDYLNTLPAGFRETVQAIGEGRQAPPSAGNRSKQAIALLEAVNRAYPGYDATAYPTYASTRKAFTSGPIGVGINAFSTALSHLDNLERHIPDNTGLSTVNWLENKMTPSGSQRSQALARFDTDATAVSNEVARAYKGGVITKEEFEHMEGLLNRNDAPSKIKANIEEFRDLLRGKLRSYQDQWEAAMPPGTVSPLMTLQNVGQHLGGGGAPATRQAAPAAAGGGGASWFSQHPVAQ